jgi:CubicO group peptidase (beta-lactamase class C family)
MFRAAFVILSVLTVLSSCQQSPKQHLTNSSVQDSFYRYSKSFNSFKKKEQNFISSCFEKDFNGTILVYKKNKLYKSVKGYTDLNKQQKLDINDVFQMASVSKTITSIAILQLHQNGVIHLDSQVSKYLKELKYPHVTVRHLLSHRSGLANYMYYTDTFWKDKLKVMNNQDLYQFFIKSKPKVYTAPDVSFSYNNTNFALLPVLLERVTGQKFPTYVEDSIFKVAGMRNSFFYGHKPERIQSTVLTGRFVKELYEPNYYLNGILGDKSFFSCVEDMFMFYDALKEGRLLDKTLQDVAFQETYKPNVYGGSYGLGFRIKYIDGEKWVYHNGWWKGFWTFFWTNIEKDICLVVLTNNKKSSRFELYDLLTNLKNL